MVLQALRTAVAIWVVQLAAMDGLGQSNGESTGGVHAEIFADITAESGIAFRHQASPTEQKYLIETMGAGVAMLDYDSDGLLDVFFINGAALTESMPADARPDKSDPLYWNRLYRNGGDGTFNDVTESAGLEGKGYGMGVATGDFNNDGHTDLYVTNYGTNILYRNEGNGHFTDITSQAGVGAGGWSVGAAFLDYDADGHLDLVVARYLLDWGFGNNPWCGPREVKQRGYCHPGAFRSVTHLLYHNEGDGTFREVSEQAGLAERPGKGLGAAITDYNRDGRTDIVIANDQVAQQLFRNNGDGTFEEEALVAGMAYNTDGEAFAGMGLDSNDYNNDGWPDIFINALSLSGYALFENHEGDFEDVSAQVGIAGTTMPYGGWGTKLIDYDNDGWKDLFVAQGHVMDTIQIEFPQISFKQPFLLMRNVAGHFEDVSSRAGAAFQVDRAARGVAFGDIDRDGYLDLAISENNGPAIVLSNNGGKRNWILIETVGTTSNRDGIGARVRVKSESGFEQYGFVSTASSYLSASDRRLHFGLGADISIKEIEVHWPSGSVQRLEDVEVNQVLVIKEPARE